LRGVNRMNVDKNTDSKWKLSQIPFFDELKTSKVILIAGCGGGYDIYAGLPLFFNLRNSGYKCLLWNLTFTDDEVLNSQQFSSVVEKLIPNVLWKVSGKELKTQQTYFPELYLAQYLQKLGIEEPVFTAGRDGVLVLKKALQKIIDEYSIDTVVMVDGGTDSLMRGDELGLGTPHEDMLSIKSLYDCDVKKKFLVCLGFGIDAYHNVCHSLFLENTAQIIKDGGYLGAFSLMREMEEAKLFVAAVKYATANMETSIVQSSVMNAVLGEFGDFHDTDRTKGSTLFINPLMGIYWCYELNAVAKNVKYLDSLGNTKTYLELCSAIKTYRESLKGKFRPHMQFPH